MLVLRSLNLTCLGPDPARVMGSCSIKSAHGTFLRAHPGKEGAVDLQESAGAWETWTIESLGENLVCIKSNHKTLLTAHRGRFTF